MKRALFIFTSFIGIIYTGVQVLAQNQPSLDRVGQTILSYQIGEQGMNHRVWNKVVAETNEQGQVSYTTNRAYVELASGLNYQDSQGQWQETKEQFELVPGWAAAKQGPHKVYLAYNLNTKGAVGITLPTGENLRGQVLGLSYLDPSTGQSVLLGEVKDSVGKLVAPNQVVYEDAFTDLNADVRYTYTKAGVEQDVILREQLPDPSLIGMDPDTTRLAVITEFIDPPQAIVTQEETLAINGTTDSLPDDQINFGPMRFGRGKAFELNQSMGTSTINGGWQVGKRWATMNGRTFLFEEVSLRQIKKSMEGLPKQAFLRPKANVKRLAQMQIPKQRTNLPGKKPLELASRQQSSGLVLDYVLLNFSTNNFTFQGDTTYYVSGQYYLDGVTTIEGGAVLKYAETNTATLSLAGSLVCKTGPYRMAVLTSKNDNSAGETISGSTGNPTNSNSGTYLSGGSTQTDGYRYLRLSFAGIGLAGAQFTNGVWHCQFVQCQTAVSNTTTASVFLYNVLLTGCGTGMASSGNVFGENLTADQVDSLVSGAVTGGTLTNCVLTAVSNLGSLSTYGSAQYASASGVYLGVGAGNYYLAAASTNRDVGSSNINATLLANLKKKTTYGPILRSNVTASANVTLSPEVQRDADSIDLGYHYDPIDYLVDLYSTSTNINITLTNGIAVGFFKDSAFILTNLVTVNSIGTVEKPNWFTTYNEVQEQPIKIGASFPIALWPNPSNEVSLLNPGNTGPSVTCNFTKFSCLAGSGGYQIYSDAPGHGLKELNISNCEFFNGANVFSGVKESVATIQNSLFVCGSVYANATAYAKLQAGSTVNMKACTFRGGPSLMMVTFNSGTNFWEVFNTCYDSVNFSGVSGYGLNDYNAFFNCSNLPPHGASFIFTNSPVWISGPLGDFYQPTDPYDTYGVSNPLSDAGGDGSGSVLANTWGLYHFTTQTNQVKETNSVVDIGYHYVAVDGQGNPQDTNGDGLPDYLQDANGDGAYGTGDWGDWTSLDTDGDGANNDAEILIGRNPLVSGAIGDTNGVLNLRIYTPLR